MKKMTKWIGFPVIFLILTMISTACSSSSAGKNSTGDKKEILRVGMECAYAPFNWTQLDESNGGIKLDDGTYAGGYDVEIAKRVAKSLNMELEIVKTEWDGLPPSLTSNKIDIIIAGMTDTPERRETIDFTDSYYTSDLVMVVKKGTDYADAKNLSDFTEAKITGQQSTLHYDVIDQIPGVAKEQAMKDFPTMIVALASGKIDGYVSERPGALSAVASNPELIFIDFQDGEGFEYTTGDVSIAIGIRKDDGDLKDKINKALGEISESDRNKIMEEAVKNQPLSAE